MKKGTKDLKAITESIFLQHGGIMRTAEALQYGIHPRTLYAMREQGHLEQLGRGLYRLSKLTPLGSPDLVSVAKKIPRGVVCLISALAYFELTTQIPHEVYIALGRGSEPPKIEYPPLRIFWFSGGIFSEGVEQHTIDGVPIRIYSPEKTLADCFKYRNKIGLDVAIEALRLYREHKQFLVDDIMRYARLCRVEKIMRPYLEALL
jgi:predicted transcriptional regulator of viral defense system